MRAATYFLIRVNDGKLEPETGRTVSRIIAGIRRRIGEGAGIGHVVRDTDWRVIDIDIETGQILFAQRWKYIWIAPPGQTPWTYPEKRRFHSRPTA